MNGWNCSTRINAPRRPGTFFLKLQGLIYMAGFISILAFLAFAGAGCQTDTNTTTFSGQADVPQHVILASGDVVKLTFSSAPDVPQSHIVPPDGQRSLPPVAVWETSGRARGDV